MTVHQYIALGDAIGLFCGWAAIIVPYFIGPNPIPRYSDIAVATVAPIAFAAVLGNAFS